MIDTTQDNRLTYLQTFIEKSTWEVPEKIFKLRISDCFWLEGKRTLEMTLWVCCSKSLEFSIGSNEVEELELELEFELEIEIEVVGFKWSQAVGRRLGLLSKSWWIAVDFSESWVEGMKGIEGEDDLIKISLLLVFKLLVLLLVVVLVKSLVSLLVMEWVVMVVLLLEEASLGSFGGWK